MVLKLGYMPNFRCSLKMSWDNIRWKKGGGERNDSGEYVRCGRYRKFNYSANERDGTICHL
jgi:hypothetical protein